MAFFNRHTGRQLQPIFDQYLRHAALPVLELKFGKAANDIMVKARQTNDIAELKAIQQALRTAQSIEELRVLLQSL